ncbi:MAG: transporter substrate-binding domain-containing protein [Halodesulfurarchaeum sp.]
MIGNDSSFDRRSFLKVTGAAGTIGLAGLAGCTGGDEGEGETTEEPPELVAGTAPGFPPFEEKDGDELIGFDIDLLEAVVAETDYELDGWEEFEFGSLSPAVQEGKIDVIAAAMTINDDRDESIDFTDPYYDANQAVLVANETDFGFGSLPDLEGYKLGAQKGTTGEGVIQDELIDEGLVSEDDYNSYEQYVLAIEDLLNGNIDAVVLDTPVADSFVADREVTVAFTYETGEQYGFGIREGESDLQAALNDGLATVNDDGTYEDLVNEWFA